MTVDELVKMAEEFAEDWPEFRILLNGSDRVRAAFNLEDGTVNLTLIHPTEPPDFLIG